MGGFKIPKCVIVSTPSAVQIEHILPPINILVPLIVPRTERP